jgi:hypothetical protein
MGSCIKNKRSVKKIEIIDFKITKKFRTEDSDDFESFLSDISPLVPILKLEANSLWLNRINRRACAKKSKLEEF